MSQAIRQAMPHSSFGPLATLSRSPPQPAAATSASACDTPWAPSQMPSIASPTVLDSTDVQPLPSSVGTSGSATSDGCSPETYISGCNTCSVEAGGWSYAASTRSQPADAHTPPTQH